ncbi:MAG: hypothetical protein Q8876_00290 [Bacillota bacterium]|nr:hypothetical protein [Bacillota bacterium]
MVRGINRQIIEIIDTGNMYYERALLVVRPEYAGVQRAVLEREAKQVLNDMQSPSCLKKSSMFLYWFLRLGAAAVVGAIISALLLYV